MTSQNKPPKSGRDLKAERLAEALRANLSKRKALARSKRSKSGQDSQATVMPHTPGSEEGDGD